MAQEHVFAGQTRVNPSVNTDLRAITEFSPAQVGFSSVLIIDQGKGAFSSGGTGIKSRRGGGSKSVNRFTSAESFRDFVGGGAHWGLASALFSPANGVGGVGEVIYLRACETTSSGIDISTYNANAKLSTVNEGYASRGVTNRARALATLYLSLGKTEVPTTGSGDTLKGSTYSIVISQSTGDGTESVTLASIVSAVEDTQADVSNKLIKDLQQRGLAEVSVTNPVPPVDEDPNAPAITPVKRVTISLPSWIDTSLATGEDSQVTLSLVSGSTTDLDAVFVDGFTAPVRLDMSSSTSNNVPVFKAATDDITTSPGNKLLRGYSMQIMQGERRGAFIFTFYRGGYRGRSSGLQPRGVASFELSQSTGETREEIISRTPPLFSWQEFEDWSSKDSDFSRYFILSELNFTGRGVFLPTTDIPQTDEGLPTDDRSALYIDNLGKHILFDGGKSTYDTPGSTAYTYAALSTAQSYYPDAILAEDFGEDVLSAKNKALQSYYFSVDGLRLDSFLRPDLYIGGSHDSDVFDYDINTSEAKKIITSTYAAEQYNDNHVKVIHGGVMQSYNGQIVELGSIYKTALVLGRIFGLQPQVPATAKDVGYLDDIGGLTIPEEERATRSGVLVTRRGTDGLIEIIRDVSTQQNNASLYLRNANSYDGTITRMQRFLVKQVRATLYRLQFQAGRTTGANRVTFSTAQAEEAVKRVLASLMATALLDNIILDYSDVVSVRRGDAIYTTAKIVLNSPINFHFFLGVLSQGDI